MKQTTLLILTLGVFSIINTEMGVIGILPLISARYQVDIATSGLLVGLFALAVAVSGPTMPLLFSGVNRKKAMLLVLGIFFTCNLFSAFATDFTTVLVARVLPAFFHPIYCSLAFTVAAASAGPKEAPRAVAKVLMGVSAGMVLGVPIVSLLASVTSLQVAMFSFAAVNAAAFLATWRFIPSMPVSDRLSYGAQISVLKRPVVRQLCVKIYSIFPLFIGTTLSRFVFIGFSCLANGGTDAYMGRFGRRGRKYQPILACNRRA